MLLGDIMSAENNGGKKRKTEKKKTESDELQTHLIRLQADFENYQKHVAREQEKFVKTANRNLMKDLLDVIDSLEKAIQSIKEKDRETAEGLEMIYQNLINTLGKHGLKPIQAQGEKFDPYLHEIMLQEESDKEEGTILEELQKGYMLNSTVLRHTKVKVAK